MKRLLLLLMFIASTGLLPAQTTVEGTVADSKTGETIIGASVLIKGTAKGTVTDIDGNFRLVSDALTPASVIVFSYIGYTAQEVVLGNRTRLDIKLAPADILLNETVVIGYGSTKRRNVLGAVSKVSTDELTRLPVPSVDQALQGLAAGVQVTQNTGAPGEGVEVRIRGTGSISSSNSPLYIVDGIPTVDALKILSAGDIESISVLKDASAAAVYGSRATNGIVLITTKKGTKGEAKVMYHGEYGYQFPVNLTKMVNTTDYVTIYNEAATNDNAFLPEGLRRPLITAEDAAKFANVNYMDELLGRAPVTTHELQISGGTETSNYLISTSLFNQNGIIRNTGYSKGTARVDLNSDVSKWLTLGMSMMAGISSNDIIGSSGDGAGGNGGSVVRYALFRTPAIPVRFPDGHYVDRPAEYFGDQKFDSFLGDGYNPIGMADYNDNNQKDDSFLGKVSLIIKPTKGLTFTTNYGMDYRSSIHRQFYRTWGTLNRINARNGLSVDNIRAANWTLNNFFNYETTFSESHHLSAMLGFEAIKNGQKALSASQSDFPIQESELIYIGNGTSTINSVQSEANSTLASFFGRFSYDYMEKYYLSFTARRDGSSRFEGDNKWGNFYSASAGWAIKQEAFLADVQWLESLKLRAGYGAIGNQEIGLYANKDRISPYFNYPFGGVRNDGYAQTALGNPNLKWETSYQYNAGIDAELWKGAFAFSVDYFYKVTKDMLVKAPNPPSVGYAESSWINSGSVLNSGVELEMIYRKKKVDWGYSISGNVTFLHNEVLKLDAPLYGGLVETGQYATRTEVGHPIGSFYLLEMDGIFQNETDILLSASQGVNIHPGDVKFKDQDGNTFIDNNDRVYLGSANPKFYGGATLSGNYKNFDVSMFFQGSFGNKIYVQVNQDIEGFYRGFTVTQRYFDKRWTGEGTSNTQPRAAWTAKSNNARPSSRFLEDGSYLRLKNFQLGYTIPSSTLDGIGLKQVRVYLSATNLLTFTKFSGSDPEMTVSDNSKNEGDRANGIDWGTYPSAMTLMLGLNINF
ncbi:MAG: SusC/RagA family TonB-linked outer membrane protein [Bacteroidales bacterium]